ncbi:hypothetical protein CCR75_002019 [Bremia lactucae]|uniref:Ribosome recycling factor domain-containing protein n=1 Tax=Bremia lactucae TaxID=4779 RepID=A0A976FET0_BRELC|nr:hypothetical protein CCR75_002019 [Bremia lactucae]
MALRVISCRFIRLTSRSTPRSLVPIAASAWTCPTSQPVSVLPVHTRSFAKTKKRNSSAVLPPRVEEYDDDNELNDGEEEEPARILAKASKNMKGAVVNFMRALNQMRPSCADGGIFDELHVQAYGHHVLLAQVAQVAIAGTHALSVTVYDASLVQNVKKAIESTNPIYSVRENVNSLEISFPVYVAVALCSVLDADSVM